MRLGIVVEPARVNRLGSAFLANARDHCFVTLIGLGEIAQDAHPSTKGPEEPSTRSCSLPGSQEDTGTEISRIEISGLLLF